MSSKSKRRVTVDPGNTVTEDAEKRKPSVFERLGPGAGQRKYPEYDSEREKKCRPFLLTGECPYGSACIYKHVQLSSKSRSREEDASPENLRLKLKGGPSGEKRRDSDSEPRDPPARSASHSRREKEAETPGGERSTSRRDKETKIRSQVVVKKAGQENPDSEDSGDDSESNWFSSLDYKKELELEQKRQQLQRELSQLAEEEVENITIQKKVPLSPSESDSSPERGRSSKRAPSPHDKRVASPHDKHSASPAGRSKKEKKKHRTKSPLPDVPQSRDKKVISSPGPERVREHKRKHEGEEEVHKKHKKKKERKRSLSPSTSAPSRSKKKDKWGEEPQPAASRSHTEMTSASGSRQHSQPHSKHSRSTSSDSSASPPRSKAIKAAKAKAKAKKKKSRAGKGGGGAESDTDGSHSGRSSKKWLSPLKKTLKLKKVKSGSITGDRRAHEERVLVKQKSPTPKAGRRRGGSVSVGEDPSAPPPPPPSSSQGSHVSRRDRADLQRSQAHSSEKREKKMKGRPSQSPEGQLDRSGSRSSKRGNSFGGRKSRKSQSPAGRSRGDNRDLPFDRRGKGEQRERGGEGRKGDDRGKRPPSPPLPPRQAEMYSPSQLDHESPAREATSRRGRQGERDPPREDDRPRGQDREGRRGGEKFESRTSSQDRGDGDRFSRRSEGDGFDQYSRDRGPPFDADRSRWDYRDSRPGEPQGDRDQRGRSGRGEHFERGGPQPPPPPPLPPPPPREQVPRGEGVGRDTSFERPDSGRGSAGGRGDGRGGDLARDDSLDRGRGDNRGGRDRSSLVESGKYASSGGGGFGPDGQRRSGQWEGAKGGDWVGGDRGDLPRDLGERGRLEDRVRGPPGVGGGASGSVGGGRLYRDEGRGESGDRSRGGRDVIPEGMGDRPDSRGDRNEPRMERGDNRQDRGDNRTDRGENRIDRGDNRMDRGDNRLDRGDNRLDRGDNREGRMDRDIRGAGDRVLPRGDGRHERLDRGENRLDNLMDQRGFRQGRGMVGVPVPGPGDNRCVRGVDVRTPTENSNNNRSFDFDRRDPVVGRIGERDGRMERERDLVSMGQLPPPPLPRERFGPDFRGREEPGFRDNLPPDAAMRDRHVPDDRFLGPEVVSDLPLPPRVDHRFDEGRDVDRMPGPRDERGRERMLPRGQFDFGRGPVIDIRVPPPPPELLLLNQRRGPLLPTPVEEPPPGPRRIGREPFERDRELLRAGRGEVGGPRDARGRRDQREGDFGPDMGGRGGRDRDLPRDVNRDWEREKDVGRAVPLRDPSRDGRRGFGEEFLDADRSRDNDFKRRGDNRRGDIDKAKDSPAQDPITKRLLDKKDGEDGSKEGGIQGGERGDDSDTRRTRSTDDVHELTSAQRSGGGGGSGGGKDGVVGGGVGLVKGRGERDTRSDGKRSPDPNQGKAELSSFSRQPIRARSLSPKQRSKTPADVTRSPGRRRSPGQRSGMDAGSSPTSRSSRGGRSRTPVGTKRRLEEDMRSPRSKDPDTKSPATKRLREDSRSPARGKGSRHPSPAGSLGSQSSVERRRRVGGLTQRDPEPRFFGPPPHDRDSPARRGGDRERADRRERGERMERDSPVRRDKEKASESIKGDSDKMEGLRKRGRSPPRPPHGRGVDSGDRGRKRWRGDGTWSESEAGDGTDRDIHKQKGPEPKVGDDTGEAVDTSKTPLGCVAVPVDAGKGLPGGRSDSFVGRGSGEERTQPDGYSGRGDDSFPSMQGRTGGEGEGANNAGPEDTEDNKDAASLKNMLYEDYEKISSDESDFEAEDGDNKQTQNIVSVLDIDWASLAKESTPKPTTGFLLRRFHPAVIFNQIGVSRALAGDALFQKIEAICREGLPIEDGKENSASSKDKENMEQSSDRQQISGEGAVKKQDMRLLSDIPVLHMAAVRHRRERANLLRNLGPFRRALCARRDLEIRRQLCKVDKVYEQPAVFPTHVMDSDLCKLSMQLFRQGRDFVERKDSECDGKMELVI